MSLMVTGPSLGRRMPRRKAATLTLPEEGIALSTEATEAAALGGRDIEKPAAGIALACVSEKLLTTGEMIDEMSATEESRLT